MRKTGGKMSLNTNEVRARAADFARDWQNASYERGEAQSFYNDFFAVFGMKRRQVATFEEPVRKLGGQRGFIDLFWKGVLLVEHKSAGRDLIRAKEQALDYFPNLKPEELPRYVLLCDFQNFELFDLEGESPDPARFTLAELPQNVEAFNFVRGLEKREFKDQDPVNIKASELVGKLHDALEDSGYTGHDLERLLVRLVFCFFADDTGIFDPRNMLLDYLQNRTAEDGSDTGSKLMHLFEVLNTPRPERQTTLDEDLDQFPYINGELFAERLRPPSFNSKMRTQLLEACDFNWSIISPAIFGALFQSVMDKVERRKRGAHYTTELNILKLIGPLFLDRLWAEFHDIKA
ncbi:MAG TPA: type IIL restriction-modification enzyme MmeI, partial [Rhizomicrobium sp.]|nr:type IIL restriction-modification enzyme MmeI [Rhizomicrobium sp.]